MMAVLVCAAVTGTMYLSQSGVLTMAGGGAGRSPSIAPGATGRSDGTDLVIEPAPATAPPATGAEIGIGTVLPNPVLTPGAVNPAVRQDNIGSSICRRGYTVSVRPPVSVTEPIKRQTLATYGANGPMASYELDHLIPLELGGAPANVANLWPESRVTFPGARDKDQLENYLRAQVCSGSESLAAAQRAIATDWVLAYCRARLSQCPDGSHLVPLHRGPGRN
ncbi:MAG: hypothetical protein ACYCS7_12410 [Acidimicrobiales bacterium]